MQKIHTHKHFTLVELLVVVAIMLIILGLTAPAFRNLAMGSAVDVASRMVSSQLMLARAEAIARREYIAVIMPDNNFDKGSDTSNYSYTAFRSAIVTQNENGSDYDFVDWVQGTNWTFLPTGAIIRDVASTLPNIITTNYERSNATSFLETSPASFSVCKETHLGDMIDSVDNTNNNIRCIVFRPNGRLPQAYYVTIKEGIFDDTRDNLADNCNVLELNQYTGQTRFIYTGRN